MKNSVSIPYSRLWLPMAAASLLVGAAIAGGAPASARRLAEWRPVEAAAVVGIGVIGSASDSRGLDAKETSADEKSSPRLGLPQSIHVSSRVDGTPLRHGHDTAGPRNKAFGQRFANWLEGLQMLLSHFPVVIFLAALALQLRALQRRKTSIRAAETLLIIGAIGATVAALVAWLAGDLHVIGPNGGLLFHRWLETAIALLGLLLMYLVMRSRRVDARFRRRYFALAASLAGFIAAQGLLGGTFIHGGHNHSPS